MSLSTNRHRIQTCQKIILTQQITKEKQKRCKPLTRNVAPLCLGVYSPPSNIDLYVRATVGGKGGREHARGSAGARVRKKARERELESARESAREREKES